MADDGYLLIMKLDILTSYAQNTLGNPTLNLIHMALYVKFCSFSPQLHFAMDFL